MTQLNVTLEDVAIPKRTGRTFDVFLTVHPGEPTVVLSCGTLPPVEISGTNLEELGAVIALALNFARDDQNHTCTCQEE
jgi:hypothetical protein